MFRGFCVALLGLISIAPVREAQARLDERPQPGFETVLQVPQGDVFPDLALRDELAKHQSGPGVTSQAATQEGTHQERTSDEQSADGQASATAVAPAPKPAEKPDQPVVHTDYQKAMQEAIDSRKMLFIYFYDPRMTQARMAFETRTLHQLEIQEKLRRYVYCELPTDVKVSVGGQETSLLDHGAFAEMLKRPGVAIVDLVHDRADYYGHVVSTFPFTPGKYYRKEALSIILDLPPGTLTQRTMIYAVRIHPEAPASTQGQFHKVLADEAKSHADYQASIQVQGHHSWDSRFHRINSRLPGNVLAQEVVAESWPNETLVEACVECVDSWRQSPGHWSAVRSRHPLFGYDIKRGRNGIWYATGIFGLRRR
jgi:hypothetical protein